MPLSPQADQNNIVWAIREDLLATNEPLNDIHQALLNREAEVHKDSEVVVAGSTEEKQRAIELLNASTALRDRLTNIALPALPIETRDNTKANLDERATQFTQDLGAIVASAQEAINALSTLPEISLPPSSAATAELEKSIQQAKAADKVISEDLAALWEKVYINFSSLSRPTNPYSAPLVTEDDKMLARIGEGGSGGPNFFGQISGPIFSDQEAAAFIAEAKRRSAEAHAYYDKQRALWDKLKPLWDATGR